MRELRRAFHRRTLVLAFCLIALLAVGGAGSAIGSWPNSGAKPGDVYAGAFADEDLLQRAQRAVAADPDAPEALVRSLERTPEELAVASPIIWTVVASEGSTVDVEVVFRLEDRSFSAAWSPPTEGRACRSYSIENGSVTVTRLDCPAESFRDTSG